MTITPALNPIETVREAFPDALLDVREFRGELTLIVAAESVVDVLQFLRDKPGLIYNFMSDISAVDYYPDYDRPERFAVSYHLYSMVYNRKVRLKTFLSEDNPVVGTAVDIWPVANWLEREIHDMMGIKFDGHPDLRRLLMPDDWQGHPQRRDYPLGYETPQFSFNVEEIMKHKPFADRDHS